MDLLKKFCSVAEAAGAVLVECQDVAAAVALIAEQVDGGVLLPVSVSCQRVQLAEQLTTAGISLPAVDRTHAAEAVAGISSACFAIADTGSLVLESTAEDLRLATTLPSHHFVLLDRSKVVADGLAAVEPLRRMHQQKPRNYIAYITGPSRTADIERVLTIGVHGPKRLTILLLENWSSDLLEM